MSDQEKPALETEFVADFREGEAMCREWIAGRGDLRGFDLLHLVRDMLRGGEIRGREAGFLITIDAAVRGDRRGEAGAPDPAKAQALLEGPPSPEAPIIDMDELVQRRRQLERAAMLERFGRNNDEAWAQQRRMFAPGDSRSRDADWRGL